ncbi:MAG: universal stress protein [Haloarculaceae archaeon]
MFDRLLVPLDGSDESVRALEQAVALARAVDASLHVLTVVDVNDLGTAADVDPALEAAASMLEDRLATVDVSDLPTTTAVEQGIPDESIRTYADEHDIDLVVMGTHGRTGVRRFVLGSVTEKVVRLSDVPVLVVRVTEEGRTVPYEDILVPTDGSEGATATVDQAATLAAAFDATVHVVSVVDSAATTVEGGWSVMLDNLEDAAADTVESLADAFRERGVERVETAVEVGTPHRTLAEYVEAEGIDLVAMGTHGRSGIERYLLGSVTEKLLRTCPAPVLAVRIDED